MSVHCMDLYPVFFIPSRVKSWCWQEGKKVVEERNAIELLKFQDSCSS
jgi:hypothetical protein